MNSLKVNLIFLPSAKFPGTSKATSLSAPVLTEGSVLMIATTLTGPRFSSTLVAMLKTLPVTATGYQNHKGREINSVICYIVLYVIKPYWTGKFQSSSFICHETCIERPSTGITKKVFHRLLFIYTQVSFNSGC